MLKIVLESCWWWVQIRHQRLVLVDAPIPELDHGVVQRGGPCFAEADAKHLGSVTSAVCGVDVGQAQDCNEEQATTGEQMI